MKNDWFVCDSTHEKITIGLQSENEYAPNTEARNLDLEIEGDGSHMFLTFIQREYADGDDVEVGSISFSFNKHSLERLRRAIVFMQTVMEDY